MHQKNIKKLLFSIFKVAVLMFTFILFFMVFIPRTYDVPPLQPKESMNYWNLKSGSKIGYDHFSASGIKKPYPIIFLQGGPGSPVYRRNIESLSSLSDEGYDIYLYDQVGCGYSSRLKNIEQYTPGRHKSDLEEIIKQIGADKVILIGQSWGAILAVLFIADNPEKIDKVIFTGPGPIYPLDKRLADIEPPDSLHLINPPATNKEAKQKAHNIRTQFVAWLARSFAIKLASDKEMDQFQTYLEQLNKATVCDTTNAPGAEAGGGFYAQIMTVKSLNEIEDPRPKLKNLNFPVLIMKGQCDNQKWGYITEYFGLFPVHKFSVIPNAGHSISIEQPGRYLETIRRFLNNPDSLNLKTIYNFPILN
jgi:proline iminopeptidase